MGNMLIRILAELDELVIGPCGEYVPGVSSQLAHFSNKHWKQEEVLAKGNKMHRLAQKR